MKGLSLTHCNALIIISILLTGCMNYGNLTESSYSGQNSGHGKSDKFYIFFQEDQVHFNYEPLGKVKTVSNRTDTDTEVLERMAYEAWNNGANAILFIQSSTMERTEGTIDLLPDSNSEEEEQDTEIYYEAVVYQGVAAYINITDEFIAQYGGGLDLNYVKDVETDLKRESNSKAAQGVFTVIGGLFSLVVAIAGRAEED